MNDERNATLVRQVYAAFQRGEIEVMLSMMSQDITWELPEMPHIPQAGRRVGRDQVRDFFHLLGENQEPVTFEIDSIAVDGDRVIARGRYEWRVVSTGKRFTSAWTHEFHVQDGLITGFVETTDVAAAVAAYSLDAT